MHDDARGRLKLAQRAGLVVFLASAAVSGAAAVLLDWMIALVFGQVYEEALPAFVWLLPGVVAVRDLGFMQTVLLRQASLSGICIYLSLS